MVDVFVDISPTLQSASIEHGANRLWDTGKEFLNDSPRWSVAESRLVPGDVEWLKTWARNLKPSQVAINLRYSSRSPRFGLLFLTLAAEVCRRETNESDVWSQIRRIEWADDVWDMLFNKQGVPKAPLYQAIESACQAYSLRNTIGENSKHWFSTIKLQFGLTRAGLTEQLGKWLYFHTLPTVAQSLWKDELNGSASFAKLIETLMGYQENAVEEADLREFLAASPWILPEWVEDVIAAAECKPVGTRPEMDASSIHEQPDQADDSESFARLEEPVLVWNSQREVEFTTAIRPELDSECSSDRYFVMVNDEHKALFIRQAENVFAPVGQSTREINLPGTTGTVRVAVTDGSSEPLAVQLVDLFDEDQIWDAWVESGNGGYRRVDADQHRFDLARGYTFRVPLDVQITPSDAGEQFRRGNHRWLRLGRGELSTFRMTLDGVELFSAQSSEREPVAQPSELHSIGLELFQVDHDQGTFRVRVSLPSPVRLLALRAFGQQIELPTVDSRTLQTSPIDFDVNDRQGQIPVWLAVICHRRRIVVRRTLTVPGQGLFLCKKEAWQKHDSETELNVGELRREIGLIRLPPANEESFYEPREWVVRQGYRQVTTLPTKRPGSLHGLSGWGQPLELTEGKYNRLREDRRVKVASSVIDRGCVLGCLHSPNSSNVVVCLQDPLELSRDHEIIVWTSGGHVVRIDPTKIQRNETDRLWQFHRRECGLESHFFAVAVAYRGKRLGAWWDDAWWEFVRFSLREKDPEQTAAMIRWFQFPVLEPRMANEIQEQGKEQGLAFAKAWLVWEDTTEDWHAGKTRQMISLNDSGNGMSLLRTLRPSATDPAWYEVIRHTFANWSPKPHEAEELAGAFKQTARLADPHAPHHPPLADLVDQLSEAAPLLMGRLVRQWLSTRSDKNEDAKRLVKWLAERIAIPKQAGYESDGEYDSRIPALKLPPPFVEAIINSARDFAEGGVVEGSQSENLHLLMQHPRFCRLVAAHLLTSIPMSGTSHRVAT